MQTLMQQVHAMQSADSLMTRTTLIGSPQDDLIVVGEEAGDTYVAAGGGDDRIYGGDGKDRISSGSGDDFVVGGAGDDLISTGDGADVAYGGEGFDFISGGAGNDFLSGDAGEDLISGGDGDDRIIGGTGNDTLIGGDGSDVFVLRRGDGHDQVTSMLNQDSVDSSGSRDSGDGSEGNGTSRDRDIVQMFDLNVGELTSVNMRSNGYGRRFLVVRYGESDQLTIRDRGPGARLAIDAFRFKDIADIAIGDLVDVYSGAGGTLSAPVLRRLVGEPVGERAVT